MALFRYRITPRSAFATPLRSDTLYGHLLWVAAEWEGSAAVEELIQGFEGEHPPFKLSSASPEGTLPMPILTPIPRDRFASEFKEHGDLVTMLDQYKQFRKQPWLPLEDFEKHRDNLSHEVLFADWLIRENTPDKNSTAVESEYIKKAHQPHNSIDRNTGSVLREGGLHFTHATWYADGVNLDLYVETDQKDLFEGLFARLGEIGYGADRTTGKGQFSYEQDADFDQAAWSGQGDQRFSLSLCAASTLEVFEGTWKPEIKRGRAWSGHGEQNPFKKPFFAFAEGSIFKRMPKSGYLLRGIHSNPGIVQVTWPVTVPVKVEGRHAD